MMKLIILLASALLMYQTASAANVSKVTTTPSRDKAKLGTSFRFDGSNLHGKYQNSLSTTATVENDKFLEDLLGARKHFTDRESKDLGRN